MNTKNTDKNLLQLIEKEEKRVRYVATNNGECMYLDSAEEAHHYYEQGWVILRWNPLHLERKVVVTEGIKL